MKSKKTVSRPKKPVQKSDATPAPAPIEQEEADPAWVRAGLSDADFHAVDDSDYRAKLSTGALFSAFLGAYDDDPIEAGMLSLADELEAVMNLANNIINGGEPICMPGEIVPKTLHRCAARLRVLAELHRRAVE